MLAIRAKDLFIERHDIQNCLLQTYNGIRYSDFCRNVSPTDGTSQHWIPPSYANWKQTLPVRVVTAVYFCATKSEAFAGRGKNDYQSSHDLEDLMAVVDGRVELVEEIHSGPEDVRA